MFQFLAQAIRRQRFPIATATIGMLGTASASMVYYAGYEENEDEVHQTVRSISSLAPFVSSICRCEAMQVLPSSLPSSAQEALPFQPSSSPSLTQENQPSFHAKDAYEILEVVGEGAYGLVYRARRKSDGMLVALKTMPRAETGKTEFEREVSALQQLSKKHLQTISSSSKGSQQHAGADYIVQFYDLHRDDATYYLAMELIEGGELFDHLVNHGAFSEGLASSFLRQFAEAIHFVHRRGLVHCDLKPENLMLSSSDTEKAVLKLVDFGCAANHDSTKSDMQLPADEFAKGCSFLHMAALGNQFELERLLIENPGWVNFRDYDFRTALHLAASEGHVDICRFLVAKGAYINRCDRWGNTPLDDAYRHANGDVIQYLRQLNAKFGSTKMATRFVEAASVGNQEEVKALLEFGDINVDQGDYDRRTALHLAAGEGRLSIVKLLCKAGADVNVEDRWGGRPLDDARKAKKNSAEIVEVLEKYGAKPAGVPCEPKKSSTEQMNNVSSGTIAYWPPEMTVHGAVPTPATDMWAAGVIMFVLLTGSHPFDKYADKSDEEINDILIQLSCEEDNQNLELLNELVFDERTEGLSDSCIELMRSLLHPDPKKRMTSDSFLRHPWVQGLTASWAKLDKTHSEQSMHLQARFRKKILKKFAEASSISGESLDDKSRLREIFNAIDLEGNGVLDPNELRVVLRSAGEEEDTISRIVASLDLKQDGGKVHGVSWDAFQKVMNMKD